MRRKTLFLAALLLAMAVTGCRKKETIDLSTLHTTAAETENQAEEKPTKAPIQLDTEHTEAASESEQKYSVTASMETYTAVSPFSILFSLTCRMRSFLKR